MSVKNAPTAWCKLPVLLALVLTVAACAQSPAEMESSLDPDREALAFREVQQLQDAGMRVWCVPFARNVSGIDIYGDAKTWWTQAKAKFQQDNQPHVGAVMTFKATRKMPLGHVAVVSAVNSPREILVDHANWERNQVSLGMRVVDVSAKNDWSAVRLESRPNQLGSVYPVQGFILPPQNNS